MLSNISVGVDIELISRFKNLNINKDEIFLNRVFLKNELDYSFSKKNSSQHLAVRFAAKEAITKAITSLGDKSPSLNEIEIIRTVDGIPYVDLPEYNIKVSLSHCEDKAIGFAIVEKVTDDKMIKHDNLDKYDFADYIREYNLIQKNQTKEDFNNFKKIKIAVLASSTIKGLKESLFVKCFKLGICPDIFVGGYNQYHQDILNENSELYDFKADLVILFIDTRTILGDQYLLPYDLSDKQRTDFTNEKLNEIKSLILKLKDNCDAKILLHNFEVPLYSSLKVIDNKQEYGLIESIKDINQQLVDLSKLDSQFFVLDYDAFCSKIGKENIIDHKMYYLGDIKIDLQHIPRLCDEYVGYLIPLMSLTKKCIVLDLDNTLWGGVVGEDGIDGIKLGPTSQGKPFLEFQKYILSLFKRGVILAINSKNNPEDALKVIKEHPYMILREEHFAAMRINWDDKISNIKSLAEELNISTNSFVFFDDDELNREMIKDSMPEVHVVDLPSDPSLYLNTIMELNDFNLLQITEEDKKKGTMYVAQKERSTLKKISTDITEYLKGLDMKVDIQKATSFSIPRIAQLTQKTNQFNMTTKRYYDEDINKFANDNKFIVASLKAEDKFGDNGITGVAILEKDSTSLIIDTFLLSCRIIGRKIEEVFFSYILKEAKKQKCTQILAEFIPSKKNLPARDFYKNVGFKLKEATDDKELWVYNVTKEFLCPDFIKVILGD